MADEKEEFRQTFETMIAVVIVFIVAFATILNSLVIVALLRPYHKLRFRDYMIVSMAFCDLFRVLLTCPFEISGLLNHQFNNDDACKVVPFFMYFLEYTSIAHLILLVFDRYICTCQTHIALKIYLNNSIMCAFIISAYVYGIFLALLPVFGMGIYGHQSSQKVQCGIVPRHDIATKSYISLVLFFVYLLPLIFFFLCMFKVHKQMNLERTDLVQAQGSQYRQRVYDYIVDDKKQVKLVLALTVTFICTWCLYDVCLAEEIYNNVSSNEYLEVTTTCIGQSSGVITPLLFLCYYKDLRITLRRLFNATRKRTWHRRRHAVTPANELENAAISSHQQTVTSTH